MHPIFIPSKNRVENSKTIEHMEALGKQCTVVVESEDYEAYSAKYPNQNFLVLPLSNMGISFVRNFILQAARLSGYEWFWMIDDDIQNFFVREGTKMVKQDFNVLDKAEEIFMALPDVAQASLEYQQLAWSATSEYRLNTYNDVCVCINTKLTSGLNYREYVSLKEDRDFTMQIIKSGKQVCRVTRYAFGAPKNGSNKGGLKEEYDTQGRELLCSQRMIELWGNDVCRLHVKDDGRPDVKINWKAINSTQISLF